MIGVFGLVVVLDTRARVDRSLRSNRSMCRHWFPLLKSTVTAEVASDVTMLPSRQIETWLLLSFSRIGVGIEFDSQTLRDAGIAKTASSRSKTRCAGGSILDDECKAFTSVGCSGSLRYELCLKGSAG